MLHVRTRRSVGHIPPCLPSPAERPPAGPEWLHEIRHDGFRIMARCDGASVRLITRHGNDFTSRFPLAAAAVTALPARSFLLDGEAIVTNDRGLAASGMGCRSASELTNGTITNLPISGFALDATRDKARPATPSRIHPSTNSAGHSAKCAVHASSAVSPEHIRSHAMVFRSSID
jgi:hypothetical protein